MLNDTRKFFSFCYRCCFTNYTANIHICCCSKKKRFERIFRRNDSCIRSRLQSVDCWRGNVDELEVYAIFFFAVEHRNRASWEYTKSELYCANFYTFWVATHDSSLAPIMLKSFTTLRAYQKKYASWSFHIQENKIKPSLIEISFEIFFKEFNFLFFFSQSTRVTSLHKYQSRAGSRWYINLL